MYLSLTVVYVLTGNQNRTVCYCIITINDILVEWLLYEWYLLKQFIKLNANITYK